MAGTEIELKPVDFITVGTIGPKGQRVFHLQAGKGGQIVSFVIEKEQAWALGEAVTELINDLDERYGEETQVNLADYDMELREPIQPLFRIAQMGLSFDEDGKMIILIAQEMLAPNEGEQEPSRVVMWCTMPQMRALCLQAIEMVNSGRPDPKQNGRIIYYWT